jgi:hypothetical protein
MMRGNGIQALSCVRGFIRGAGFAFAGCNRCNRRNSVTGVTGVTGVTA